MRYAIHHIHIKSDDPKSTADWFVGAFGFSVISDETRALGDRFIRLRDAANVLVMISGRRTGEVLEPACTNSHLGLDHFGMRTSNLADDLDRLTTNGAQVVEGPHDMSGGIKSAFLIVPGDVRVELIEGPAI